MRVELDEAEAFFHKHAGYSRRADESRGSGRTRNAILLADAEVWARDRGVEFCWTDNYEAVNHVREFDGYESEPETCEACTARLDGRIIASLGCIDGATAEYRRVVEAELAQEARWTT